MSDKPYDFGGLFLLVGGSLSVMAVYGWLANIITFSDFLCALFAAYVTLRITNAMERGSKPPRKR